MSLLARPLPCLRRNDSTARYAGDCCAAGFRSGLWPLWVKLGHSAMFAECPLYPRRHWLIYSITSSALHCSVFRREQSGSHRRW